MRAGALSFDRLMINTPSPNGHIDRDASGRFAIGNAGGPGNPHARRIAKLRSALLAAIKPDDLRDVVASLLVATKAGDVAAARLLLEYSLGRPRAIDDDMTPPDRPFFAITINAPPSPGTIPPIFAENLSRQ